MAKYCGELKAKLAIHNMIRQQPFADNDEMPLASGVYQCIDSTEQRCDLAKVEPRKCAMSAQIGSHCGQHERHISDEIVIQLDSLSSNVTIRGAWKVESDIDPYQLTWCAELRCTSNNAYRGCLVVVDGERSIFPYTKVCVTANKNLFPLKQLVTVTYAAQDGYILNRTYQFRQRLPFLWE